ncbi:MAG: hypothetical protein F6K23_03430 [Okeania sp. SIO2C9]|uniref:hypothetical protein n=1 Tax=Okeania sp. SIO2C9 TaxID=2607791 RepID=UPI0013BF0554|nr:hypothetical protein [Okeania sp. SIO2C9]NEQ72208.1 hypothetical protein [Okeania sp. SIO2C9]
MLRTEGNIGSKGEGFLITLLSGHDIRPFSKNTVTVLYSVGRSFEINTVATFFEFGITQYNLFSSEATHRKAISNPHFSYLMRNIMSGGILTLWRKEGRREEKIRRDKVF